MTQPTYRRHPMDKRRPAPHSPERLRLERRFKHFRRRWLLGLPDLADTSRFAAAALSPDPRQETRP